MTSRFDAGRARRLAFGAAAVLALRAVDASAQAAAPAAPSIPASGAPSAQTLETVNITAEKRSVDLQKAPLAVTAISGSTLDKSNITDLSALNGQVPGLSIAKSSGFERIVTIRGIGSETPENSFTSQPGVALHIDGVFIANTIALDQSLFDIDRIEVLRGPQGTLYGQSSTGGTINLVTKQPELGVFSGSGDVSIGNYDLRRARAELNLPIGTDWAVRGSVQAFRHAGFAKATGIPGSLGYGLDDANDRSAKLAVLWRPSADFSGTLTGQWYRANQHGAAQKSIGDPNPDPRTLTQDYPARIKLDADLYHANLQWNLPFATLKSITGYQTLHHQQQQDSDRLTYDQFHKADGSEAYDYDAIAAWTTRLKNLTQEVNLASLPGGRIDWIVGVFGMRERTHQFVAEFSGLGPHPELSVLPSITTQPPSNLEFGDDTPAVRTSWSGFFQTTFHASERLRLTGGARYTRDLMKADLGNFAGADFTGGAGPAPLSVTPVSFRGSKPTGKLEADYDLTPGSMVYVSVTRGYKPGGVNNNGSAVVVGRTFVPETVTAYEVGSKNRLMDNRLRLNAAAFLYKYQNQQYLEVDPVPFAYGTANIPKTDIWGAEIEASYLTMQSRLRLNANLTMLDGRFPGDTKVIDQTTAQNVYATSPNCAFGGQFYNPACWSDVRKAALSLSGRKPAKLPNWQGSVNAAYTFDLPAGTLIPRIEYVYRGAFDYRLFNTSGLDRVPSYGIWNLHLQYSPTGSNWTLSVAGSNLANKAGVNSRFTDPYGRGATSQEYIAPRQVVATAGYSF